MKKKTLILFSVLLATTFCFGQTKITIKTLNRIPCDTLWVLRSDISDKSQAVCRQKFAPEVVLRQQRPLEPGLYWLSCDSTLLGAFLISSDKNQEFTIEITEDDVIFHNTPENEHYRQYITGLQEFEQRMQALNYEYQDAQRRLPAYMLGPVADSLNAKATRIMAEKRQYQQHIANVNTGTLLASFIRCHIEMPQPPADITKDRTRIQEYILQHYFDDFTWNDPRIFHTPIASQRIKEFCGAIANLRNPAYDTYVMNALHAAKVDTATYFATFDLMEKLLGHHGSTHRIERLYIAMLKDMLTITNLPEERKRHCNYELRVIDKNHEGEIAPDFKFKTDKGETHSLHDLQSEYLLLYFQHPTCPTCQQVRHQMANFPILNKAIATGRLKVLTIYFEDEEEVWNNYIQSPEANPAYLHGWNYDQSIETKSLYETRAIPYMFLLDKDKRIIKKNVLETELEDQIRLLHILN